MAHQLVIVESPAKAKTIEKFLGSEYRVLASFGHVRALPSKQGSVDTANDFEPKYHVLPESKKHIDAIKKELKGADRLLLATDPDREGEAISWHLLAALGLDKKPKIPIQRVVFHEITKDAIIHAVQHPRDIAIDLVDAQQARSILDYLVGFNLSPFLWKKIRYGLSAGRVQSVALRLVCEREKEIQAFVDQEYWTIGAKLEKQGGQTLKAGLVAVDGKKLGKFDIPDQKSADALKNAIAQGKAEVASVTRKEMKRNPAPPFTTSTLQQEASRKLGFSAKKTMSTAQKLYEGVAIGEGGTVGLITYMRTDSVNLSAQALKDAHDLISVAYGKEYALAKPRFYKNKSKNAQEAHEAIRPTYLDKTPAELKKYLTPDLFKLYELIWKRTVACQMAEALLDQTSVDIAVSGQKTDSFILRATGSVIRFPGFMKLYIEGVDDEDEEKEGTLPALDEGEALKLLEVLPEQHFTQPPPRYTEATLVKTLEEYGIGRPSTYASTLNTLVERKYARLDKKRFFPEDVGMVVNDLLTAHFPKYVDYNFTAGLEEELDQVSRGEKQWKPLLREFWNPFISLLKQKEGEVKKDDLTTETLEEACPECGKPLAIKLGKRGKFIACTGFKEGCKYTRNLENSGTEEAAEPEVSEEKCDKCGQPMLIKSGRYGKYLACSGYPACKNIQPLNKPKGTGVTCPECKEGELTEKKSRYGKMFYSCNRYPDCKFALWDPPVTQPCPKCGFPVLVKKVYKKKGEFLKCPKEGCDYTSA
ncbi:type I DNA topoisomerase [Trichlorobacter lovleyi]|uniref:DNA topoisomerase 1 n=1 Tax=Trichlorobacter lovleyi (strain ATCC BAA-1151 / DSM 17278 / SZ) TaxID=398767 RepID=B3EAT9_TRIL1|nr:type I DNA topoisomerase [Trichlorobacter lovleyi]ACD96972.1 DNA topoisomerase I [Trichlorobacter lovleyi SZ]